MQSATASDEKRPHKPWTEGDVLPLRVRARWLGKSGLRRLEVMGHGSLGTVVHASASSIHVRTHFDELLVVTRKEMRSPINVNVVSGEDFDKVVLPFEAVVADRKALQLDRVHVDLTEAATYAPPPLILGPSLRLHRALGEALKRAAFEISLLDGSCGALDAYGLTWPVVRAFVREAWSIVAEDRVDDFLRHARRLVGLGPGFTPSGDDFLGGFLAVFNTLAPALGRRRLRIPMDLLAHTTWISGKLLDYMQQGLVDEELRRAIESIAEGRPEELRHSVEALARRGHTSGVDMSAGAIVAGALALDLQLGLQTTQRVAEALGL